MLALCSILVLLGTVQGCERTTKHPTRQPSPAATSAPQSIVIQQSGVKNPELSVTRSLGFTFQKGMENGLELAQAPRGWAVVEGEQKFDPARLRGDPIDFKLRVDRIQATDGTAIVQLDLTPEAGSKVLAAVEGADQSGAPALIDETGASYKAVGFVYKAPQLIHLRISCSQIIERMSDVPVVMPSQSDRSLRLMFAVTSGAKIREFRIGDGAIVRYDPPLIAERSGR